MERPTVYGAASFGLVSFGAVALLALLVAAAIWAARNPYPWQTLWARVRDAPAVRRVWDAPVVRSVRAWSSEQIKARENANRSSGYWVAGILLLVQLAVVAGLADGFTEVLDD